MNLRRISVVMVALTLMLAGIIRADAFDPKQVPATAIWMLHVDIDALHGTQILATVKEKLDKNGDFLNKMSQLKAITGIGAVEDFHDITLYGASAEEAAGVVVVHAPADRERILTALQGNPGYGKSDYHDHTIYTWRDGEKNMFGAFANNDMTIIGRSQEVVQTALDTLDGTGKSIDAKSTMADGAKAGVLVYVAARDLPALKKKGQAQNPVMVHVDSAWISLSEDTTNVVFKGLVVAKTPEAAAQIKSILEGIKGLVNLSAGSENPDPNAKLVAQSLENLKIEVKDMTVSATLPVDLDTARQMIDNAEKKHEAVR